MPAGFSCGHCSKVFIGEKEKVYHSAEEHIKEHGISKSESEIKNEIEDMDESEVEGDIEKV